MAKTKTQQKGANFRLRRPAKEVMVLTRHITTGVGGRAIWGAVKQWYKRDNVIANVKEAISFASQYLRQSHMGTIVYVVGRGWREPVPIYEAKWGHDDIPFEDWKGNPTAHWWSRKIKQG